MDKRAAGQYLTKLFGKNQGFVAVAYKHPTEKDRWQEAQFAWPDGRANLLTWAEEHKDDNVFVCPALRKDGNTRKKGDMQPTRWLWADVDWQAVPADKVRDVHDRIADIGTYVVASGSGDNAHVYVELNTPVEHAEFIKLNTGLRDYLYGDNKQADNSLLRLPGTTNWKTESGSPVRDTGQGNGRKTTTANLLKRRAFRDAKVIHDVEATDWSFVEIEDLPRKIKSLVNMPVDKAEGLYGNRHKAVWAVTGDLIRDGRWDEDQIHSMMDKFPAALSKAGDENGYDVHKDVDKRLAYNRATEALTVEEQHEIEEEAFELASDEDDMVEYLAEVKRMAHAEMMRSEARKLARTMEAERTWVEPPPTVSRSLTDALSTPLDPEPYLIDGLAPARGNVVLTAQYKSGKTDLLMGSLARSLADGVPFLDHFQVFTPEGGFKVGHWNLEMDETHLIDGYIRPSGYENTDNLVVASLRGYRVNILSEVGRRWTVAWLKDNEIKVWTIDSIAQLARMAGVGENANDEMANLLGTVDEIKQEAGVDACFLIAHTGRAEQEKGKERARAATIIDDWPDSRWVMTVETDEIRYLQVQGRGTSLPGTSLNYDTDTHRYTLGGQSRQSAALNGWVQTITTLVNQHPQGLTESTLHKLMREAGGPSNKGKAVEFMEEAADSGFIRREKVRPVGSTGGGRVPWMHFPTADRVEGDRARKATIREVDLTNAGGRGNRRARMNE